jgi:phage gpG-like protein
MAGAKLTVTIDRTGALRKALADLVRHRVLVGIPDTTAEREPDPEDPHPLSNAAIGYIHEFGAPEANIPARPFLRPGVQNAMPEIIKRYQAGAKALLDGRITDADQIHNTVGLIAQSAVKAKITDGPFAALSDATLANRKAKGRTGTSPLIDTGQLRNAVTCVIRPAKR